MEEDKPYEVTICIFSFLSLKIYSLCPLLFSHTRPHNLGFLNYLQSKSVNYFYSDITPNS